MRVFTRVVVAVNAVFLIWLIVARPADCGALSQQSCASAKAANPSIGLDLIVSLWVLADIILGVVWLISRRGSQRERR